MSSCHPDDMTTPVKKTLNTQSLVEQTCKHSDTGCDLAVLYCRLYGGL